MKTVHIMKKKQGFRKLVLRKIKISTLEAREAPVRGNVCSDTTSDEVCDNIGTSDYVGLDNPPEFEAVRGGTGNLCEYGDEIATNETKCFDY